MYSVLRTHQRSKEVDIPNIAQEVEVLIKSTGSGCAEQRSVEMDVHSIVQEVRVLTREVQK